MDTSTVALVSRFLHLLGVILWIGGTLMAALIGSVLSEGGSREAFRAVHRSMLVLSSRGLILAWLGGLVMLAQGWSDYYARAGWMHGKLLLALVASGLTGVIHGRLRRAASA